MTLPAAHCGFHKVLRPAAGGTGADELCGCWCPDLDAWRSGPSLRPIPMGSPGRAREPIPEQQSPQFHLLGQTAISLLILMTVVALSSVLLPRCWRLQAHALLPPLLLALAALIASATLSWVSYEHHYWILDRQWVASLGLMPVAVVWYAAELGRIADKLRPGSGVVLAAVCLAGFLRNVAWVGAGKGRIAVA